MATILDLLSVELNSPPASAPLTPAELVLLDDAASVYSVEQPALPFGDTHRALKERLVPLARVQAELETWLATASREPEAQLAAASNREVLAYDPAPSKEAESARTPTEFFVRATRPGGWKRSFDCLLPQLSQKQARERDDEIADGLSADDPMDDAFLHVYEHALERLACASQAALSFRPRSMQTQVRTSARPTCTRPRHACPEGRARDESEQRCQ